MKWGSSIAHALFKEEYMNDVSHMNDVIQFINKKKKHSIDHFSPPHTYSLSISVIFSLLYHTLSFSHSISLFCLPHTDIRVSSPSSPNLLTHLVWFHNQNIISNISTISPEQLFFFFSKLICKYNFFIAEYNDVLTLALTWNSIIPVLYSILQLTNSLMCYHS